MNKNGPRILPLPERRCARCNKVMNRRKWGKHIEGRSRFLARKYCSVLCGAEARTERLIGVEFVEPVA